MPRAPNFAATSGLRADRRFWLGVLYEGHASHGLQCFPAPYLRLTGEITSICVVNLAEDDVGITPHGLTCLTLVEDCR